MFRPLLLAVLFLLISINMANAEAFKDLEITADILSYSEDGTTIEASGSVEAIGGDLHINAAHLIFNVSTSTILADKGFTMRFKNGLYLKGDHLGYNLKTKNGITKNVWISFRNSVITGGEAKITEEKVELMDATFNTCGLEPPHYHIYSRTTTLYPEEGWVIGYWGYLWAGVVPAVPVPVYLYDLSSYGTGKRTEARDVVSLPEIGSNDDDGTFIRYKVPWIANRKLTGRLVLNYTEKGGMGEGVEANYDMDDNNDLYTRIYYDPRYNYFGGITHTYRFGPKLGKETESFYTFFKINEQLLFELSTNVSYREKINYERVSMLPDVTLRTNDVPAIWDNFMIGGELSYGHITEETSGAESDRGIIKTNGYFTFPTDIGSLHLGLGYNQSWYGFMGKWTRLTHNIILSRNFNNGFDGYIGHMHYMIFDGDSIFRYEAYKVIPSDEFSLGSGYNFGPNRLSVDYSYYVPSWETKDLDYGLSLGFHCYTVDIKYRAARREFLFGVGLINQ